MPEILLDEERQELRVLLASGIFTKAPNVQSFLEYVAEKYFAGEAEEVKEYQIALEALHRSEGFNPQSDTIVRVTAHSLRKRLDQYYSSEGADHFVHIQLPTGRYLLRFVHRDQKTSTETEEVSESESLPIDAEAPPMSAQDTADRTRPWIWGAGVLLILTLPLESVSHN